VRYPNKGINFLSFKELPMKKSFDWGKSIPIINCACRYLVRFEGWVQLERIIFQKGVVVRFLGMPKIL